MNADLNHASELSLCQADEASQRRDVLSGLEAPLHESLSEAGRNHTL